MRAIFLILGGNVGQIDCLIGFLTKIDRALDFSFSVWSNDVDEQTMQQKYSANEYLKFFNTGKISYLHIDFVYPASVIPILMKVIFHELANGLECEVIVYREGLLPEIMPQTERALTVLSQLKEVIEGSSLFIGPDNLDYPESDEK